MGITDQLKKPVQDAGGSRTGQLGEVFRCTHCTHGCDFCSGSGFRSVCDSTECYEYGCSKGTCGSSQADFERWEAIRAAAKASVDGGGASRP